MPILEKIELYLQDNVLPKEHLKQLTRNNYAITRQWPEANWVLDFWMPDTIEYHTCIKLRYFNVEQEGQVVYTCGTVHSTEEYFFADIWNKQRICIGVVGIQKVFFFCCCCCCYQWHVTNCHCDTTLLLWQSHLWKTYIFDLVPIIHIGVRNVEQESPMLCCSEFWHQWVIRWLTVLFGQIWTSIVNTKCCAKLFTFFLSSPTGAYFFLCTISQQYLFCHSAHNPRTRPSTPITFLLQFCLLLAGAYHSLVAVHGGLRSIRHLHQIRWNIVLCAHVKHSAMNGTIQLLLYNHLYYKINVVTIEQSS